MLTGQSAIGSVTLRPRTRSCVARDISPPPPTRPPLPGKQAAPMDAELCPGFCPELPNAEVASEQVLSSRAGWSEAGNESSVGGELALRPASLAQARKPPTAQAPRGGERGRLVAA